MVLVCFQDGEWIERKMTVERVSAILDTYKLLWRWLQENTNSNWEQRTGMTQEEDLYIHPVDMVLVCFQDGEWIERKNDGREGVCYSGHI